MLRLRLIEFHEQPWFPQLLRDAVTDVLQLLLNLLRYAELVAPVLAEALRRSGKRQVVDLCSGSGGPWRELVALLGKDQPVSVLLTDKFPNCSAADQIDSATGNSIVFCKQVVRAEKVPVTLHGFRTLFNCFHHFEPADAESVLADAVNRSEPVAIFEVPRRHPLAICAAALMGIGAFVLVPFIGRFSASLFFWTYVVPVIPFVMWFDGTVSCLRAYTPRELRQMSSAGSFQKYTWSAGTLRQDSRWVSVTYLIGMPSESDV